MIVWAFEALVASNVLMLLVLAVRGPVRRAFGPDIAYALWAIPAARMVLPPLPDRWHEGAAAPLAQAGDTLVYYVVAPLGLPTDDVIASGPGQWSWLLAAWALGAIAFIAYHAIAHRRFCARIRRRASRTEIVASGNVAVIETDAATGPLAFGVWRKYVAFPRDFADRYDPLERDLALAHELGHHARGDLLANWAALVVLAFHWFNPVAWRAFRAFRADQEMACDALVLAGRARELRAAYGRAIVKSAHGGAVSAACHLHTVNDIKGRLRMLSRHEKASKGRMLAGAGATAALLVGGLGLTASGTQAAESVRTRMESAVGVDLASLELPTLPPPPAPPAAAPSAPAAPIVIVRDSDDKVKEPGHDDDGKPEQRIERRHPVSHDSDGKPMAWPGGPDVPMPPEFAGKLKVLDTLPEIGSRDCRDGEGKPGEHIVNRQDGGKRVMVICTNRIERMASLAAHDAERASSHAWMSRRNAGASALEGLRNARRTIEANRSLSDIQRSAALSGIDQAIREAEAGKD